MNNTTEYKREVASAWFTELRNMLCGAFEEIEDYYASLHNIQPARFERKKWDRDGGGGGEMSVMRGNVFEKVGVNVSTVFGEFNEDMRKQIPGAKENPSFFATGISLVSHMHSPHVPAAHFNTRYITTSKEWFGGGGDLTPLYPDESETKMWHKFFKDACDKHNPEYYPKFTKECDEYFFLSHRNEPRGVGGIFYDYLYNEFHQDLDYTKDVGLAMLAAYPKVIMQKINKTWNAQEREDLLKKRGRYAEFNLLHDRGTRFGLMTGGNIEAILMSLPPEVKW